MNEGPFRVSRPADRRPASRPTPTPALRQPEEPQFVPDETRAIRQAATPQKSAHKHAAKPSKRLLFSLIGVVLVVVMAVGYFYMSRANMATAIDSSKYQAVFFTNGQVYFGKLHAFSSDAMKLTDIYYLQSGAKDTSSSNPQATSNDQNNVQLIKLGDEIHGPEDEMVVAKDQMLFYENLKPTGKVAQSIAKYKKP